MKIFNLVLSICVLLILVIDHLIQQIHKKNNLIKFNTLIKVIYKNKSVRIISLFLDEEDNTYRFINITKDHNHICKCKFKNITDAMNDLCTNTNVESWEYVTE